MEAQYAVHPASLSVQAPCYLYEHELDQHQRQLASQMSSIQSSLPLYTAQPQQNQQEHQQQQQSIYPPLAPKGGFEAMHANQIASSQPTGLKPTIVVQHESQSVLSLDTRFANPDFYQFPSTPPLSTSGSTISSPPSSCGMVQTPMDGSFFSIEKLDGAKEGCDAGVSSESLAKPDWARSESPPLTPGTLLPHWVHILGALGLQWFTRGTWGWLPVRQVLTKIPLVHSVCTPPFHFRGCQSTDRSALHQFVLPVAFAVSVPRVVVRALGRPACELGFLRSAPTDRRPFYPKGSGGYSSLAHLGIV